MIAGAARQTSRPAKLILWREQRTDGRQLSHDLNQPVEKDLQMLKDLGLDPNWDKHDFCDQNALQRILLTE